MQFEKVPAAMLANKRERKRLWPNFHQKHTTCLSGRSACKPLCLVVGLPKKELHKNKRPRRNPLKMAAATLCFGVILATVTTMIYNQVQLTELTEEINTAAQSLQEAESLEIQLNMEAAQEMNGTQVEEYAANELGMSKIQSGQVTYVGSSQEDQGDVLQEATQGSWMDQLWAWLQSLFA